MLRRLILTAAAGATIVFGLAWNAWATEPTPASTEYQTVMATVAKVNAQMLAPTVEVGDGCSGQIIYSERNADTGKVATYVLTAKHCVDDLPSGARLTVTIPRYAKGKLLSAEVFYAAVDSQGYSTDLALVKILDEDRLFHNIARLAPLDPDLLEGEPVWAAGYPLRAGRTITQGLFNAGFFLSVGGKTAQDYTRTSADIAPGSSGGGLYHMAPNGAYELIGVTSAGARNTPFVSLFTSIYDIQKYLKAQAPIVYRDIYEPKSD